MDLIKKLAETNGFVSISDGVVLFENEDAIRVSIPKLRALVTVSGGEASFVADPGVAVEMVDWDHHPSGVNPDYVISPGFRDLATAANISGVTSESKPPLTTDVLQLLNRVSGRISIDDGVGTFEDGTTVDFSAAQSPRVFVSVKGGIAEETADPSVDAVVFDFDNYAADPDGTDPVPANFRDFAEEQGIPVEDISLSADMRTYMAYELKQSHGVEIREVTNGYEYVGHAGEVEVRPTFDDAVASAATEYGVAPDWADVVAHFGLNDSFAWSRQVSDGQIERYVSSILDREFDVLNDPEFQEILNSARQAPNIGAHDAANFDIHYEELLAYMNGSSPGLPAQIGINAASGLDHAQVHRIFHEICAGVDAGQSGSPRFAENHHNLINALNTSIRTAATSAPLVAKQQKRAGIQMKPKWA
jgi:hypothetical protein